MPTEVFMPKMTDHMETALLDRWLVQPGERLEH
jgi:pyruvate/2-oxoglutarate dehydrogenase complex dihydrolipoamide acyltransferase (E2) component